MRSHFSEVWLINESLKSNYTAVIFDGLRTPSGHLFWCCFFFSSKLSQAVFLHIHFSFSAFQRSPRPASGSPYSLISHTLLVLVVTFWGISEFHRLFAASLACLSHI